jgi:dihydropteroate synthase
MGVLNLTPDSFSEAGRGLDLAQAQAYAEQLRDEGADIIDVGGESTRPGAEPVSEAEELRRVLPMVRWLVEQGFCVSIDTRKTAVMEAACAAGVEIINDVEALRGEGALDCARRYGVGVCLMHMQGEPRTMQRNPQYTDVVSEVRTFLLQRSEACQAAGIEPAQICLDPGFGFGKRLEHNLRLLAELSAFVDKDHTLMVGLSRKGMLGELTQRGVDSRSAAGAAAAALAVAAGADVIRTHDVASTRDAIRVAQAVRAMRAGQSPR